MKSSDLDTAKDQTPGLNPISPLASIPLAAMCCNRLSIIFIGLKRKRNLVMDNENIVEGRIKIL